ncbi:MAG TPA: type VI secretion system contractile sheath small subunit [Pyrinomonadaceae bacterium]|jgi:type VI secretion system protein ImpB|nr:type VI secretion system contractile sheath small subunit [Pyrinomonadaceae bacterium]
MAKKESTQQKLSRVRAPRVHITYEVEIGGAIEQKDLPFVLGVLGDFAGHPAEQLPRLRDRKLIEIDRDNFDQVLSGIKPRLAYRVENTLAGDDSKINVELHFNSLQDFEPDKVVQQVEPLRKLIEIRQRLSDLLSRMDGNDRLEILLQDIIQSTQQQQQLSQALGFGTPDEGASQQPKEAQPDEQ